MKNTMKNQTIYKISAAPGDQIALNVEDIAEQITSMRGMGSEFSEYDIEVLSSLSSNRTSEDGDSALAYEIPAEWMPELVAMRGSGELVWWSEMVKFAESKGFEESFDGNKFGSWGYAFTPESNS